MVLDIQLIVIFKVISILDALYELECMYALLETISASPRYRGGVYNNQLLNTRTELDYCMISLASFRVQCTRITRQVRLTVFLISPASTI